MPAYRSSSEAEVRDAVVERLRRIRPAARIIHEINTCGFGNRVDVMAVDRAEIIAVEIKSEKDKLDRLPDQIRAMRGCAHHVIAALHEKFLIEKPTNEWRGEYQRDGEFFFLDVPPEADGVPTWIFPETDRGKGWGTGQWREPDQAIQRTLPPDAIHMLWRDELAELCSRLGVAVPRRATMPLMVSALWWSCTGRDLTRGICTSLRARKCVEADPVCEPEQVAAE